MGSSNPMPAPFAGPDPALAPFLANRDSAPAYWAFGNLWIVLVDGRKTGGAFSVMEQWMPGEGGPGGHVHPIDEWFFMLDGEIDFKVDGKTVPAKPGDSVWIPRGTDHEFHTKTDCHVLNGYTPAGVEQIIIGLGTPATHRELPPSDLTPDKTEVDKLYDNYWSAKADSGWSKLIGQR